VLYFFVETSITELKRDDTVKKLYVIKNTEVKYFKHGFAEVLTTQNKIGFINENGDEYFLDWGTFSTFGF
jgi:hypothetical protein